MNVEIRPEAAIPFLGIVFRIFGIVSLQCDAFDIFPLQLRIQFFWFIFGQTGAASLTAGCWRIAIMPIDTLKTTLQVRYQSTCNMAGTKLDLAKWLKRLTANA
jgi:hypothetical protein